MNPTIEASTLSSSMESLGSAIVPQAVSEEVDQLKQRIAELEAENATMQETLVQLEDGNRRLKRGFAELEEKFRKVQTALFRAKDPSPVERASEHRVRQLADQALMDLERWGRGWIIRFGSKRRWFKKLKDIWLILTSYSWNLSEFFDPKANKIPSRKPRPNQALKTNGHSSPPFENVAWVPPEKLTPLQRDQLEHNPVVKRQYEALRPH